MKFVLGVDEAGRGPLAGPVAVGVVMVAEDLLPKLRRMFPGVNDSKQLTEQQRERLYALLLKRSTGADAPVRFCVRLAGADTIDRKGIVPAVYGCVSRGISALATETECTYRVLLDGALRAPDRFEQETVIGGDALHPVISLASIAAKVERDRLMVQMAKRFPDYGFERHKGYGTDFHYEMLAQFGSCDIHRRSYLPVEMRVKKA